MIKTDQPAFKRPIPEHLDTTEYGARNSNYAPIRLNEVNVYQLARTGNTVEQVAKYFNVSTKIITEQFKFAFDAGKRDYKEMPQRALYHLMEKLEEQLFTVGLEENKNISHLLDTIKTANRYNGREREMTAEPKTDSDLLKVLDDAALLQRIRKLAGAQE